MANIVVNNVNFSNGEFKVVELGGRNINLNNSFKLIDSKFQHYIEMDKWFWWKKLFMSKIINNYQDVDWVFLDNWGTLFMDWFKDRFNYSDLKFNKSIKSNIKLILFIEDNNNFIFQINCAFSNGEIFRKFFNWDFSKIFKLSCEYIENGKFGFYALKPSLCDINFNEIHKKDDILNYVLDYNKKYQIFDNPLNDEIEDTKVEEVKEIKNEIVEIRSEKNEVIKNISNFFEIDDSGIWFNVSGVSYEVYDWRIIRSDEIEKIERYKEEFIFNNISIYG